MTVQMSVAVRNAMLDAIESSIGATPILKLRSGAPPGSASAADAGTVLAAMTLAADWAAAAASGTKSVNTPIEDVAADAAGTIAHYRLYAADGATCHMQGTVTAAGGGGDMIVDNPLVVVGQDIKVTAWTLNMAGHA